MGKMGCKDIRVGGNNSFQRDTESFCICPSIWYFDDESKLQEWGYFWKSVALTVIFLSNTTFTL